MNFLAHYYLDRQADDSFYFVGIASPDLISIYHRKAKMRERIVLSQSQAKELSPAEESFKRGLIRHFEVDKLFHSSAFFDEQTSVIGQKLNAVFGEGKVQRSFFVSHILLELLLDKLLIQQNEQMLKDFYSHFEQCDFGEIRKMTQWFSDTRLLSYEQYLERFVSNPYLYKYKEPEHIAYVMKRILGSVGISQLDFLDSGYFFTLMEEYEAALEGSLVETMDHFQLQLS